MTADTIQIPKQLIQEILDQIDRVIERLPRE